MACAVWAASAPAGDLQVAPTQLRFAPQDAAQALWLSNPGDSAFKAQVRVFRWTQQDGVETLVPTREIVASPPLAELAAGQKRLVRLVRLDRGAPQAESAYRVVVDELPTAEDSPQGLRIVFRYSIPLFVAAEGAQGPSTAHLVEASQLHARFEPGAKARLHVTNGAPTRARLSQIVHETADGKRTTLVPGLLGYVLAGQSMQWELPVGEALGPGAIKARINEDPQERTLPQAGLAH